MLNAAQLSCVTAEAPKILVAAGAGTGKTQVLAHRVAHLLDHRSVSPFAILCLTFTRRAAAEMAQRVQELTGYEAGETLWLGTVHAIAYRMIREYGHRIGYGENTTVYGSADSRFLMKNVIDDLGFKFSVDKAMGYLKLPTSTDPQLKLATTEYRRRLKVSQAMDYDILINSAMALLQIDDIGKTYHERFLHVLVDEVQDVGPWAWAILDMLRPANLFIVGDDSQSIFGFAGAEIERFFRCVDEGWDVFRLEQNYRCTKQILELANRIVRKNVRRIDKTLVSDKDGAEVFVEGFADGRTEGKFIGDMARALHADNGLKAPWADMAVLCRTNALAQDIAEELTLQQIPIQSIGAVDPFSTVSGQLVGDALRLMINPEEEFALRRIVSLAGTTAHGWARIEVYRHREGVALMDAVMGLPPDHPARQAIALIRDGVRFGSDAWDAVSYITLSLGRIRELQALLAPIMTKPMLDLIVTWGKMPVRDLLVALAGRQAIDFYQPEQEAVAVLTIHTAKGLEWPLVFVPGWEEGMLPHRAAMGKPEDMEEERRVAHVAVTRAADKLYCTWAQERRQYGRIWQRVRSKLLD